MLMRYPAKGDRSLLFPDGNVIGDMTANDS